MARTALVGAKSNWGRVDGRSRRHAVARGVVALAAASIVLIGTITVFIESSAFTSASTGSTDIHSYSDHGSSTLVGTAPTTATTPQNGVYVYLPYGSAEDDDGATQPLPQVITVVIGVNNTVTWINQDYIAHNVISITGAFASPDLSTGQTYTFTFTEPGTYPYRDGYRPIMAGEVIVEEQ